MGKSNKKTQHRFDDDFEDYGWTDDFQKDWKKEEEIRFTKRVNKYEIEENERR